MTSSPQTMLRSFFRKGKAFISTVPRKKKNRILTSFNYRFDDAFDIENTYTQKNLKIYYLLQRGDFKTEKVASELGTNKNNISRLLVDVRTRLKEYDIRLISRPGRGLNMEGDEINIRNCLIDSMSQISSDEILSVFNDNISLFGISQNEIDNISSICLNIVEKYKISLSRLSIKKLIEAVILTIRRLNNGHCVSFDTKQEELILSFKVNDIVNDFIDQITAYYGLKLPQSEILVTPSGMMYEKMVEDDVIVCDIEGNIIEGDKKPSSDTPAILYIFKHMPHINGVIHTHQPYATALSLIPGMKEFRVCYTGMANACCGNVPITPYSNAGSVDMGIDVVNNAGNARAVILSNHGVMTIGPTLKDALYSAVYLEETAKGYLAARACCPDGKTNEMTDEQIQTMVDVFKFYGQGTPTIPTDLVDKNKE